MSLNLARGIALFLVAGLAAASLGCQVPMPPMDTGPVGLGAVKIAYIVGSELWTVNWDGGEPVRVAENVALNPPGCKPYYISPNGHMVVYQTTDGQLWMAETRGATHNPLASGTVSAVSWFPDSRGLVYILNDQIYVHPFEEGQSPQVVASGGGKYFLPSWSPDGRYVAFLEASGGGAFNVALIKLESLENVSPRILGNTAPSTKGRACPEIISWSPDSTKILVDYGHPAFVFYVAGGTPIQISSSEEGVSHRWSPDGQTIAFRERDGSLWLINADGSGQRPLVAEAIRELAWSPVSPEIAYTTEGGPNDLWLVNAGDGGKRQLTTGDGYYESSPLWTLDGSRVVFLREGAGLWSVATDGGDLRQLAPAGNMVEVFAFR